LQQGAYFITVCTVDRTCLFGDVVDDAMHPNHSGLAVMDSWDALPHHYPHVQTIAFALMPNHVHGVVLLNDARQEPSLNSSQHSHSLTEAVRAFKSFSARAVNSIRETHGQPVWQRGFYDHVIRSEGSLHRICEYVANNPLQWKLDRDNPITGGRV